MAATVLPRVTVLGSGVLGAQIAFQTAFSGRDVTVYDINDEATAAGAARLDALIPVYAGLPSSSEDKANQARARLTMSSNLDEAVAESDLIIEAIPEILELKQKVFAQVGAAAKPDAIIATNSSTLLPSLMAESTGRPQLFGSLHFANRIWLHNTAEIMCPETTSAATIETLTTFAREIGMVPIVMHKERPGYVLNSLLVPLLNAGMSLVSGGYASVEDVDNTWKIATGAPIGPMEILDLIGLNTPYNIMSHGGEAEQKIAQWLKTEYLDKGRNFHGPVA